MLKQILNPNRYHGANKKKRFFEGWYYKIVDKNEERVLVIIPGILKGKCEVDHHSFILVIDGKTNQSHYIQYGVDLFKENTKTHSIQIENNHFSNKRMKLNYIDEHIQLLGELYFVDQLTWPQRIINMGNMGMWTYLPFVQNKRHMNCLYAEIVGKLLINNEEIDFNGGKAYIEKSWGSKQSNHFFRLQSNGFKESGLSITLFLGRLPIILFQKKIFMAAFTFNEQVYTFSTMNRAEMITHGLLPNQVKLTFIHKDIQLNLNTQFDPTQFIKIINNQNNLYYKEIESLTSEVEVELIDLYKNKVLYKGIGRNTSIEYRGDITLLK